MAKTPNTFAAALAKVLHDLVSRVAADKVSRDCDRRRVEIAGVVALFGTVYRSDIAHEVKIEAECHGFEVRVSVRVQGPIRNDSEPFVEAFDVADPRADEDAAIAKLRGRF